MAASPNAPDHDDLPSRVQATYDACTKSGDVLYYPSDVVKEDNELKTEIRLCESLSRKPGPSDAAKPKPKDVFAPEHWDSLLIGEFDGQVGEEYGLLLNKFAVVPLHFLLVTKHWELQTSPLTPPQLLASYQIIQSFSSSSSSPSSDGLLCFYNCGPESGASQEHKHLQFAPMGGKGSIGYFPTEKLAASYTLQDFDKEKPFSMNELPYAHYVRKLDRAATSSRDPMQVMQYLQQAYMTLLDAMIDGLRSLSESEANKDGQIIDKDKKIGLGKGFSYNLLMTRNHMHIIPRRKGVYKMPHAKKGGEETPNVTTEATVIGCNALAYAGTVLVKSKEDMESLKQVGGVLKALQECGYPKSEAAHSVVDEVQL